MAVVHFLNVREGDCSIIEHNSGRVSVIDVCNAQAFTSISSLAEDRSLKSASEERVSGNFNQKKYPVNPIKYMSDRGLSNVFRFILTHPDMDHLDGIQAFFDHFRPTNFWDTDNEAERDFSDGGGRYKESDWIFYKKLRDSRLVDSPKRLALISGAVGQYFNQGENKTRGGDGLQVLAPTDELMAQANECGDFNDASYVILYKTGNYKILFSGDSDDDTWAHVLSQHGAAVRDVDLLIAPHHGRASGRSYKFLDHVNPKMTFFGNARSEHLAYGAWNSRHLKFATNNQANCMIVEATADALSLYVTHEPFARAENAHTTYSSKLRAYYVKDIA